MPNEKDFKVKEYKKMSDPLTQFVNHIRAIETGFKYLVKPNSRITLNYPYQEMVLSRGYRGMLRLYKDICIGCTLCAMICPADAMKMVTKEGKKYPVINYGRCVFCGFCVDICPVDALTETGVHDAAFTSRKDLFFDVEKFNMDYQGEKLTGLVKRVKAVTDPEKGVKYEPVDSNRS